MTWDWGLLLTGLPLCLLTRAANIFPLSRLANLRRKLPLPMNLQVPCPSEVSFSHSSRGPGILPMAVPACETISHYTWARCPMFLTWRYITGISAVSQGDLSMQTCVAATFLHQWLAGRLCHRGSSTCLWGHSQNLGACFGAYSGRGVLTQHAGRCSVSLGPAIFT